MLDTSNEINIKREEKEYSWSTVFAWLYLKTIGRILPKRWNKWAENILYYNKATANNEAQTDGLTTINAGVQVDLALQSEVMSKDGGVQTEESNEFTNENCLGSIKGGGLIDDDYSDMEEVSTEENGALKEQLGGVSQELELERLQNVSLKETNEDLESKLAEREEEYRKLENTSDQREGELLAELEEKSNEMRRLLGEVEEKDRKIGSLTRLNEELEQDKKTIKGKVDEQQQTIHNQEERIGEQDALIKSLADKSEAVEKGNESLQIQITELEDKVSGLDYDKEVLQSNVSMLTVQLQSAQESKRQLEEGNRDLNDQLSYVKKENQKISVREANLNKENERLAQCERRLINQVKTLEKEKSDLEQQKQTELRQTISRNAELESKVSELRKEKAQHEEQLKAMEEACKTCEESQRELERKLENLESQLNAVEKEKENLESESAKLQKQVQTLKENKENVQKRLTEMSSQKGVELEVSKADAKTLRTALSNQKKEWEVDSKKKTEEIERLKALKKKSDEELQEAREKLAEQKELVERMTKEVTKLKSQKKNGLDEVSKLQKEKEDVEEQLKIMQQRLLDNQEQQKVGEELKDVDKRLEGIEKAEESQRQTEAQRSDTMSISIAKSSQSGLSKAQSFISKLFLKDRNLDNFLSKKNEELKKSFPEFRKRHFCHNVFNETIKSLSNQDDGKFKSSKLLELLENNLKESAKEIIETKVKGVVNEHCNIGKNIDKELRDDTLKTKLSSSVGKCIKKLELNEKDNAIVASIWNSFYSKNNNSNDLKKLLGEIIVEKLTEVKMKRFSSKIQELQLASSIRDKFLSPDQKICSRIPGKENMYQLSTEAIDKVNGPNTSMSHTNSTVTALLGRQKVVS